MRLRDRGLRVAYVDIDAHHGDGVQFAFYRDPDVLTISTHERGDRLFPGTGFVNEMGEDDGLGYSVNLPLQPFTDDEVYLPAFEAVVPAAPRAPSSQTCWCSSSASTRTAPIRSRTSR